MVNQSPRNHFTNQNFIHFIKGTKTQTGSQIRQEGKSSSHSDTRTYVCLTKRCLSPQVGILTDGSQNTRCTRWCPGWCWPTVGLPDRSHNSWRSPVYTGLAAMHFLLLTAYLSTHFQNPGSLWMETISYPASKELRFRKTKKDCNTTLHTTCSKQKLPINNLKAYYGPKKDTVLNTGGSRMKIYRICLYIYYISLIWKNTLIIKK